jgi:hypothetical protein
VMHLLSFWNSITYYFYHFLENEFGWNIGCTRKCLSEQANRVLCFWVRYSRSTTFCIQIPDTSANNTTNLRGPLRPSRGKEKVCILSCLSLYFSLLTSQQDRDTVPDPA